MLHFVVTSQLNAAYKNPERLQPSGSENKIARQLTAGNWQLTAGNWQLTAGNWQLTIDK